MENTINQTITNIQEEEKRLPDEVWRKSIPAQVFLNHFFAISYLLKQNPDRNSINLLPAFGHIRSGQVDMAKLEKLLLNAWSTEYALRSTAALGDAEYLRYSLHWTFPQAFYSVFFALKAYLYTQGNSSVRYELISREFGKRVADGEYPQAIGFYADGYFERFRLHRLQAGKFRPGLHPAAHGPEAAAEVAQFLFTTRKGQAWEVRRQIQSNPDTALRSKNGKVLEKFTAAHWAQITRYMGNTTILDLMSRLRVSANHTEIERFIQAEIDFGLFHSSLCDIVAYLNFVHESFIAKAIGLDKYKAMAEALPPHLSKGFVGRRLETEIEPLFRKETEDTAPAVLRRA